MPSLRAVRIGLFGLISCAASLGAIITTPAGLAPGTQYQLVFVTSDGFDATSGTISDYNTDVTSEAALSSVLAAFDAANGVTWTVIGSTTAVNAITNAPSSGLVFTLDGAEVASGANTLYSGTLLSPIDIDENANSLTAAVWTGSLEDGLAAGGINDLGQTFPDEGGSTLTVGWASGVSHGVFSVNPQNLFALSSVITVPAGTSSVPEPGTLALIPIGLGLLVGIRRKVRS
jgi:hypothetical protein